MTNKVYVPTFCDMDCFRQNWLKLYLIFMEIWAIFLNTKFNANSLTDVGDVPRERTSKVSRRFGNSSVKAAIGSIVQAAPLVITQPASHWKNRIRSSYARIKWDRAWSCSFFFNYCRGQSLQTRCWRNLCQIFRVRALVCPSGINASRSAPCGYWARSTNFTSSLSLSLILAAALRRVLSQVHEFHHLHVRPIQTSFRFNHPGPETCVRWLHRQEHSPETSGGVAVVTLRRVRITTHS